MDTLLTKAMIVNWALAELGQRPNFSIDDNSELGATVSIFWPRAVAETFSLADWPFCRKTYRLVREVATPDTGYLYGYALPRPRFGPPVKYLDDPRSDEPLRDTRIEGETLSCNAETVYAVCKVEVDPQFWDPQFANCFSVALAGALAVPLLQDPDMAAGKRQDAFGGRNEGGAGGMFGRLVAQMRAAGPIAAPLTKSDPLTAGRWSGR